MNKKMTLNKWYTEIDSLEITLKYDSKNGSY